MARPLHLRTQQEILDRIVETIERGDLGDESHEYMRCAKFVPFALKSVYEDTDEQDWDDPDHPGEVNCDDAKEVDRIAKIVLPILARHFNNHQWIRAESYIHRFRAWKWLLGHHDADTFITPDIGAVVDYLNEQMYSGEWDQLTIKFKRERKRNATLNERPQDDGRIDAQGITDTSEESCGDDTATYVGQRFDANQTSANAKVVA